MKRCWMLWMHNKRQGLRKGGILRKLLPSKKIVEKKANGQAIIDSLNNVIGGFEPYDPKMNDKQSRANSVTPYFESGNVWLPDKNIDPTIDVMVEEMMKFPNGEHDDEVDAMTQYLTTFS